MAGVGDTALRRWLSSRKARASFSILACLALVTLLVQTVRSPAPPVGRNFLKDAQVDARVRSILARSCGDCHSDDTRYPWYSFVPVVSGVIQDDVHRGREQLNLSRWHEYSRLRRQRALTGIANQVKDRIMPLPEYLLLHPSAKLSDAEIGAVFRWAQGERLRLIMEGRAAMDVVK